MEEVNIISALIAGFLSFLSPCVFPLIPAYISYISGISIKDLSNSRISTNTIVNLISFIFGFSIIFILFGASATFIGQVLAQNKLLISKFASLVIIVFGLNFIGIFRYKIQLQHKKLIKILSWIVLALLIIAFYDVFKNWLFLLFSVILITLFNYLNLIDFEFLNYEKKLNVNTTRRGLVSSLILGSSFAFGWTPCIGPILASILSLAAIQETVYQGIILLSFYSLGLGIPFFLAGILTDALLRSVKFMKKFFGIIEVISGILLIVIGILIYNDAFTIFASFSS
ncbi:MAG: cytochrome c biogenesis protein CcdA [candidate division WOR-3 bacterium]|nr:cytochrome c biogenesis protein CcdA [candidate division WOR-3 bacterium]MDW8149940.1 cytochrome c biogenesis protein CcdA [candidate division WOR-3 bacterium]